MEKNGFKIVNITDWTEIRITGKDRFDYLNGIITFDLDNLKDNQTHISAFLTPNAKIRSIFWIKNEAETFLIYTSPYYRDNLIEDLLKYKLNMEIKLDDLTQETENKFLELIDETNELKYGSFNFKIIYQNEFDPTLTISYEQLCTIIIKNSEVPIEYLLNENPFEVGIFNAITLEKGCFLGQEPLSRMFHRGRPRKFLYHFKLNQEETDLSGDITIEKQSVGTFLPKTKRDQNIIGFLQSKLNSQSDIIFDQNIQIKSKIGIYPKIDR